MPERNQVINTGMDKGTSTDMVRGRAADVEIIADVNRLVVNKV